LQPVRAGATGNVKGIISIGNAAYDVYIKLYWFIPTVAVPVPIVGTTVPNLTIAASATNTSTPSLIAAFPDGITGNGQLWVAVTKLPADTDTTVVLASDAIVTILVE
jgi:hypothetical protein